MVSEKQTATMTANSSAPAWAAADKNLHRSRDGLHHLGFVRGVGGQSRDADRIFGRRVVFANDAENDQRGGEQRAKGNELAALGFEKIEKIARFHRWPLGERMGCTLGVLVTVTTGGGGGGDTGVSPKP
jgi:hypothetical protein